MTNKFSLEQYLAGRQPLQPERTALPTDAELEAAEAEYDRIVGERTKAKTNQGNRPRHDRQYWAWGLSIAAAAILAFLLWPEVNSHLPTSSQGEGSGHLQERAEAKTQQPTVEMTEGQAMMAVAKQQPAPASTPPMTATTRPPQAPKHIAQAVIPATPVEAEEVVEECTPPAQDASLIRAAQTDLEYRNRLRTIEITTQAQAEQAFEAAVAAVLCSREPS